MSYRFCTTDREPFDLTWAIDEADLTEIAVVETEQELADARREELQRFRADHSTNGLSPAEVILVGSDDAGWRVHAITPGTRVH